MSTGGDPENFDDAFDRLFRVAYRSSFRILGAREDAEDVAIEALARASARWRKVGDDPAPWVTTVSVNLSLDIWRRRQRTPKSERSGEDDHDEDRRLDLVRALEQLPNQQRRTIVLRYFGDLTESETAAAMGISVGAVKQHASRAMASMRKVLGD